jgi:hypothetical protein
MRTGSASGRIKSRDEINGVGGKNQAAQHQARPQNGRAICRTIERTGQARLTQMADERTDLGLEIAVDVVPVVHVLERQQLREWKS